MTLTLTTRYLLGPGPTNPYPEATVGLSAPLLGHLDPEFIRLMDETCDMLRAVWQTESSRTLLLSATGSAGMEAAFVHTLGEGDVVARGVGGGGDGGGPGEGGGWGRGGGGRRQRGLW